VEAAVSETRGPGDRLRAEILRFLEDTAGRRNWAHKGLRAAIGGLRLDEALWKPEGGHSVWEQINHTAYWKRYILRRAQGKRTRARQAWPPPGRTAAELSRSIADLGALHRELRAAVTALDPGAFAPKAGRYPPAQLLLGEAGHESYHIGQIFLTRKLYRRHRRHRGRAR
jgi:uncharacterized damage-inducible protein DinB